MIIALVSTLILSGPVTGCTFEHPEPVGINQICTGIGYPGSSCKVDGLSCSPVPGTPGTWNPNGYTPKMG